MATRYEAVRDRIRAEDRRAHRTETQKRKRARGRGDILTRLRQEQRDIERITEYQTAMLKLDGLFQENRIRVPKR